jgi:hypothetical protein
MHADVDIAVLEFDRRPIRPDFQFDQILYWHVLQGTDPLSRDKKAGISIDDELDGIPLWYVTNRLRKNLCVGLRPADDERSRVFGVSNMVLSHGRKFTTDIELSRNDTSSRSVAGSYRASAICLAPEICFESNSKWQIYRAIGTNKSGEAALPR